MMGLGGRDDIARQLIAHGWSPDTRAAIVCGASTPDEWTGPDGLPTSESAAPPEGVAGVLVVGEVVSSPGRAGLRRMRRPAGEPDEVKYGRS